MLAYPKLSNSERKQGIQLEFTMNPVEGRLKVKTLNIEGDEQADLSQSMGDLIRQFTLILLSIIHIWRESISKSYHQIGACLVKIFTTEGLLGRPSKHWR